MRVDAEGLARVAGPVAPAQARVGLVRIRRRPEQAVGGAEDREVDRHVPDEPAIEREVAGQEAARGELDGGHDEHGEREQENGVDGRTAGTICVLARVHHPHERSVRA